MDTNFSKYIDDMEEDKEELCNSIALADAQVAHIHRFFFDASACSIWRQMNSCTQRENLRRRLPEEEEVPTCRCCSGKGRGRTCWSSHGWLCQILVWRGVRWSRQLTDIHFHDCLKAAFSKKQKKMLEEQSIQYLCSILGNLFWSIILCCIGRFVNHKCNDTTHILIWAQYLLLNAIK